MAMVFRNERGLISWETARFFLFLLAARFRKEAACFFFFFFESSIVRRIEQQQRDLYSETPRDFFEKSGISVSGTQHELLFQRVEDQLLGAQRRPFS